ncbi:hypothetical protein SK128_018810, partial [Halocaridina rubra]
MESPPRSRARSKYIALSFIFAFCTLLRSKAEANEDLPLYSRPYFIQEWGGKDLKSLKWSEAINFLKRHQDDFAGDFQQYFSEEQVKAATRTEYKVVPHPLVYTSQLLHEGVNCSSFRTNLHKNHIRPELQLRPDWIHKSELIGDCPTHYVTRELPPMYSPAVVLEAVCTCGGSQCSESGHQCVPVSRHVPVWVRRGPNVHILDIEELTVACACLRRPSAGGNFIYAAAIQ